MNTSVLLPITAESDFVLVARKSELYTGGFISRDEEVESKGKGKRKKRKIEETVIVMMKMMIGMMIVLMFDCVYE